MATHRIDLGKDGCIYRASRRLLAAGADPGATIEAYRGGMLCLSGNIGKLAAWTIEEPSHGRPSLRLTRYRAFPASR
jgi:hypothetical protein